MKKMIRGENEAPNATAYKWWSCPSSPKLLCKLYRTFPSSAIGVRFTVFWARRPCGPAGWLALLLTKLRDDPGPTPSHKQLWINFVISAINKYIL